MHIIIKSEGAADIATTFEAFMRDNADGIGEAEGSDIRAALLTYPFCVTLGGGASPLFTVSWAD